MRILYIGKFEHSYSTEKYVTWALEEAGVAVACQDYRRMNSLAKVQAVFDKHKADVILFSKPEPRCLAELLAWCKRDKILTVCWLWDIYWGYTRHRIPKHFLADMLFSTDGGHANEYANYGCKHRLLRQGIHKPDHVIYPPDYKHDVAFVGHWGNHSSRHRLLKWLPKTFGKRFIWHRNCRNLKLNRTLAQAKIIVGDSRPWPNYWSNRMYEITGRGGFLMHTSTVGLNDEFTPNVHYAPYPLDDFTELKKRIDFWLCHGKAREQIRQQGFKHCGENHTYSHRVAELLGHIGAELKKRGHSVK